MNWEAIGAVGEAVGAAGVIISLLYLAVQIRGDAREKRAGRTHDRSVATAKLLLTIANNPELSEVFEIQGEPRDMQFDVLGTLAR